MERTKTVTRNKAGAPRVAFVAGGGAVKAFTFHLGVMAAMEEDGFFFEGGPRWEPRRAGEDTRRRINCYLGSSAGSLAAASVASCLPIEEVRAGLLGEAESAPRFGWRTVFAPVAPNPLGYLKRLARRTRVAGPKLDHLLAVGGMVSAAGIEAYFRRHVLPVSRFSDLSVDFFVTATQVNASRQVVFGPWDSLGEEGYDDQRAFFSNVPISQALAASTSVPPVFTPWTIENPATGSPIHYYDGEVRETLSADLAAKAGADFVISSSIWRPYHFDGRVGSLAELGMATLGLQALNQSLEQKARARQEDAAAHARLLERVAERDRKLGVPEEETRAHLEELGDLLQHRPAPVLEVLPDPGDLDFLFAGSFRFSKSSVDRCMDAGRRAWRLAVEQNSGFLEGLDAAAAP